MKKSLALSYLMIFLPASSAVFTQQHIINRVKSSFPDLLIQHEKITQTIEKKRTAQDAFDPGLQGKFKSIPISGYESNYFDSTLHYPIENTGASTTAGYRLGRGDWPVYYQNYLMLLLLLYYTHLYLLNL